MILDDKTKGLVAVAAAVGANCVPCFRWHFNNCLKMGVSLPELQEAIDLAGIIKGMPLKIFGENVCKLLEKG
ncbi:MAG: carboxymuconolactone decarboxylase family protein [Clostridia bacterium]|nr:carboxymuconolactone decarboxylase family protein [Clostridia bacterium]